MSLSHSDPFWMARALAEAARGAGAVEPNPMVGAVVVSDGALVGHGHHERFGGPHAEIPALQTAGERARGATLYVTLEPCSHHGKTPPCVEAVLEAGVSRVVAAMSDPFPEVAGRGFARLREAGIEVSVGLMEAEARRLNAPYLKRLATGRPFVTVKWAMTLDGKTACATGDSRWISSARSRAIVHELRGRMDAILVGIGTALTDDPELTARPAGARTPVRIVIDPAARLSTESRLARSARDVPVWLVVNDRASEDRKAAVEQRGVRLLSFPGTARVPIGPLLDRLGAASITNLLVEGGGETQGAFLDAGELDALEAFVAPVIQGGGHAYQPFRGIGAARIAEALRLTNPEARVIDGDVWISGRIARPWLSPRETGA